MKTSPNAFLIPFGKDASEAKDWKSNQARRMFEAAVENPHSAGGWHPAVGSLQVAEAPTQNEFSPWGTDPEVAAAKAKSEVASLRHRAQMIEDSLATFGGSAFTQRLTAVRAPHSNNRPYKLDAEYLLTRIAHSSATRIVVHGIHFAKDKSGSFVRADSL